MIRSRRPSLVDRWRLESRPAWVRQPTHEWHHFIVFLERGTLLVNVSRHVGIDERVVGRVIVLYHAHGGEWRHGLTSSEDARFSADGRRASVAAHHLEIDDEGWDLRASTPDGRVEAALRFTTAHAPLISRNSAIARQSDFHWIMYPDVEARGTLRVDGEIIAIDRAGAYHDHNWGAFAWGDDFGWEWGIVSPAGDTRTAVVCTALTDRARAVIRVQQMFLWVDGVHVWTARGADIERRTGGRWPGTRVPRLPSVLSVATPYSASVPPREVALTASDGRRRVEVRVSSAACAQVLIPDEHRPTGVVVLNECLGAAHVRHTLGDELVYEGESPCVY